MENKKVFIGNLDFAVTEEEVKTLLSDYGTVVTIKMHKKKGCAFIEMSDESEAALAIEKLNGSMFKDRVVRAGLEINAGKAKALSIKKYNERAEGFSRRKKRANPGDVSPDKTEPDSVKTESDEISSGFEETSAGEDNENDSIAPRPVKNRPAPQRPAGSPHHQRKGWPHDRPSYSNRPSRDDRKPGHGRSPRHETNYNSMERFPGPDERPQRSYPRGRSDSQHPQRKEWSHDKPARHNRTSRDSQKSAYNRSPEHETNYNSRERFPDPDARPPRSYPRGRSDSQHPQRKEWSYDKPARHNRTSRDSQKSGYNRSPEHETNYNSRERFPDPDGRPPRNFSRGRSDSRHPQRKEWSQDRPSYSNRPSRDDRESGHGRSPRHEPNYNSRERFPDPDGRPPRSYPRGRSDSRHPQRKEWSQDKPAYSSRHSGPSRRPGARISNESKPRPSGGSPDRFPASSRPRSGPGGKNNSASTARPKARGGAGNRGRNGRPKGD